MATAAFALCGHSADVDFSAREITEARRLIQTGQAECVLVANGQVHAQESGRGVSPLLSFFENSA